MKESLRWCVRLCALALAASPVHAQERAQLPNFDRRLEGAVVPAPPPPAGVTDPAATPREKAEQTLKAGMSEVRIDADPVTRGPKWIGSTERFLTGLNGNGGAISARAASLPAGEKHRAVKMFLNEHRALFGHDATALAGAVIQREDSTQSSGLKTVVWQQMLEGVPVFEGMLRAVTSARGELVNIGSQFMAAPAAAADRGTADRAQAVRAPMINARRAIALAAGSVGTEISEENIQPVGEPDGPAQRQHFTGQGLLEPRATLVWLPMDDATMRLCWSVILTSKARGEMFRLLVDATSGEVQVRQGLTEYISNASYRVFTSDSPTPFSPGHATPLTTQPPVVARTLVTTSALNVTASPNGWIDDGVNETRGNNVDAHTDLNADNVADTPRPQAAAGRVFDFPLDLTLEPATYQSAAVTQLFYWCNFMHDKLYELGFTESAGNFQINNFGRGGLGNDAVQADAQDGSGTNNANFSTPADGSPGRMQMFLWTGPTPDRDGDFDAEVVLHEYAHGLSNRLVGGGAGISALQSRGMGEGWSDFYGIALLAEAGDDLGGNWARGGYGRYLIGGTFTQNYYFGGRRYPYSTSLLKNPLTFKDIDPAQANPHTGIPANPIVGGTADQVHNSGEVWCVTLWEARANFITKHGFATGNQLLLQLVTDGMKLSPPNPNFLQARDAILQAELALTGGANRGELWSAFAKRGMGANASSPASTTTVGLVENFDIPDSLSVAPSAGFTARGEAGGPFNVTATAFTLRNTGTAALNWTASTSAAWLTLSSTAGTLTAGATSTLTASLNAAASALANGFYTGTVTITNTTSGIAQTRTFSLRVGVIDYFTELFDTTPNDTAFQSFTFTPNGSPGFYRASRAAATAFATSPVGGIALAGHDTFNTITLTGGATVPFYGASYGTLYVGSNGYITFDAGDGGLTASLGAHFARKRVAGLMGHLNGNATAVTWRQLADRVAVTYQNVPEYTVVNSNSFQIEMFFDGRIRITTLGIGATGGLIGLSNGGGVPLDFTESDFSGYGPDNFLTLTAPAQTTEGAGVLVNAGRVTVTPAPTANLVVALTSSRPADVAVPASMTIPAGQTSAEFSLTVGNNSVLDGSRSAVLSASAASFGTAQQAVLIHDNETGVLTLSAAASAREGGPIPLGTVTVNPAVAADVFVTLTSDNSAEIQVPSGVTILAGQTTATFPITIVDDQRLDGTVATTITAAVTNWTPGSATISVTDNETTDLTIFAPGNLREGDTGIIGTVTIGGSLATPLVVALSSDDTSEITVPATVTIPAGQTTATFPITVVNDPAADGAQVVMLSAFANGYSWALAIVNVADNDADHFSITPIANQVVRTTPVAVGISARDVNDAVITNYNQAVSFTTNPASVPVTPATATGFINGALTVNLSFTANGSGVRLTVADSGGHVGVSNAFDVITGPPVRFVWNTIASPQFVDAPFPVTIRAVDAAGNSVPEFNGTASLSSPLVGRVDILSWTAFADLVGEYPNTKQAISTYFTNYNETATTTTDAATLAALLAGKHVFLIVEQENSSVATLGTIGTAWSAVLNSFVNGGGTIIVCSNLASEHLLLTNSGLLNVTPLASPDAVPVTKSADTPLNANVAVPFTGSFLHTYSTTNGVVSLQTGTSPVVLSRDIGAGRVVLIGTDFFTLGTGMDRVIANAVALAQSVGGGALPVSPAITGAFTAGEWTGNVSLPYTGGGIVLRAVSGALSGNSNAFSVNNAVLPSGLATVLAEDFESGTLNPAYWTSTGTNAFRTQVSTANSPHGGTRHLTMDSSVDSSPSRNEATLTVNLAGRTGAVLKFWAAGYNDEASGPPPSPFIGGADFDGVAMSADGTTWWEVQALRSLPSVYAQFTVDLDAAIAARGISYNSTFRIRFNQYDDFTLTTDGIVIDDIAITAAAPPSTLTLTLPAQATEGAGIISGSVSVSTAPQASLVLNLSSKSAAKVSVPPTVTIPAGQTSATFPLTVLDDPFLDGTKSVIITAAGAGFLETGATIQIIDNDGGALSLSLPASVLENAGTLAGTVSLSLPPLVAFTVALASDNPLAAQAPPGVTFARGATTANFSLTIPDDTIIDGPQTARITASAAGWTSAAANVVVQDNETSVLSVTIPANFREGDAPKTGTVTVSGTLATSLVVSLFSSDTTEISVPASVTIPAGQTQAPFAITVVDDSIADGAQPFTITASAATFTSGTASGQVRDNEAHHFTFAPIASPQLANGPVPAIVTARDPLDAVLTDYNSAITFTATAGGGALVVAPVNGAAFINGVSVNNVQITTVATGVVLTATAASGATGSSNAFDLATGAISRFAWDAIPSPQTLDTPLSVRVRAVDAGGATVPNYNGVANLFVSVPAENPTIGTGTTNSFATVATYAHDARSATIYTAAELGGAARLAALAFNVTTVGTVGQTLTNFTIRLKPTALANFTNQASWDNSGWTTVYRANPVISATGWLTFAFTTPFDYSGANNLLVDISFDRTTTNFTDLYLQGTNTALAQTIYSSSNSTNGDPLTWTTLPAPISSFTRADVRFTTLKDLPIRPPLSGTFASGVWTGPVSIPVAGAALSLKAQAGAVSGASNTFAVATPPPQPTGGATVLAEDFESGTLNPAFWTITGTGTFHTINSDLNTPHAGLRHMTMDSLNSGGYARNEATLTVNLSARSGVQLKFWAVGYSEDPNGPPASPFPASGADFDGVAISADGGVNWYEVQPLRTLTAAYALYTVDLDAALAARGLAYSANFKIRFNQYDDFAITTDGIGIDDILITANPLSTFTFTAPAQVTEGAGAVSATVTLNNAAATATVIALTSSAPAKITVPPSVTIPAGQRVATFSLNVLDDGIADGNRTVYVSGAATGQLPTAFPILVLDNEILPLSLTAPASVAEGANGVTGTISLGTVASGPVTVSLVSSDTTAVQVPASITLPPGQLTVAFPITVVNDTRIDGTQIATITASLSGSTDATATIQVTDNETRNLSIAPPASVSEGATASGTVSISGTLPTPLTVTLLSANPAQLTVTASVTIAAGATSASFVAAGVDDTLLDGAQTVAITASAATFTAASGNTIVADNDVHHFTFPATIATPQIANRTFATSLEARDVNNARITTYTGVLNLTAAGAGGALTVTPASVTLAAGVWSGSLAITAPGSAVTITARAGTLTGVSNSFDVTVGALDHLTWNAVASPQTAGVPFTATVLAKDAAENTVPTVNEAVAISTAGTTVTTGLGTAESFTLFETSTQERNQLLYQRAQVGPAARIGSLALHLNVLSGATIATTIRMKHTALADFASAVWESTGWTIVYQGNLTFTPGTGAAWMAVPLTTPFQFDGTSNLMVDISHNGGSLHVHSITTAATTARTLYFSGTGYADPLTWSGITNPTPSTTTALLNLRLGSEGTAPVVPASVTLVNGAWTGPLTVQQAASAIVLKGRTAAGIAGESNAFNVTSPPIPALTVSPADGLAAAGLRGGPFTLAGKDFTLSNPGAGTVAWTAAKTAPWLTLSATSGTLASGAITTVTASLNATANTLASGIFTDTVTFTNATNGTGNTTRPAALRVNPIGDLTVTPATNLDATGPVGGPFTPASRAYLITNSGDVALNWTAAKTAPWLTLSASAGTLAPAASTTVTATIVAPTLETGSYSDTVIFTNTTSGRGNTTRAATLTIIVPAPVLAPEPPFTGGTRNTVSWSAVPAASDYEAEAATDAAFTSPVNSGWLTGTSHTFTGLSDGTRYHYRVRARRSLPGQTGVWSQTTQAEFDTGSKSNTTTLLTGSVRLASGNDAPIAGRLLNASFEDGIVDGPIPNWTLANTTQMGAQLDATALGLMPSNGTKQAIIFSHYQTPHFPGDYARISQSVDFTGVATLTFDAMLRSSGTWSASIRAEVRIDGTTLWSSTAQGVRLNQIINVSSYTGFHTLEFQNVVTAAGNFDSQWAVWDNVQLFAPAGYSAGGSLLSPPIAPSPWQRWGALSFTRDVSSAGTALTFQVLSANGTTLASNVAAGTDLNTLAAVASQPAIRLRANFSTTNSANTPLLDDWSVAYSVVGATTSYSAWSNIATSTQDATAPALTVTSSTTTSTVLSAITGTATDAGGVSSVVVNGVAASSSDGFAHWSALVPLAIGANNLPILALDQTVPANVRSITHTVTVTPAAGDADADGLPDAWETLYGLSTTSGLGAAGAFGDPDRDGRVSLLELALGANPVVPDSGGANPPALILDAYDGKTYLTWHYRRLLAPGALSYLVETASDLATWHSGPGWVEEVGAAQPTGDGLTETVTIRALPAVTTGGSNGHLRLRVTLP